MSELGVQGRVRLVEVGSEEGVERRNGHGFLWSIGGSCVRAREVVIAEDADEHAERVVVAVQAAEEFDAFLPQIVLGQEAENARREVLRRHGQQSPKATTEVKEQRVRAFLLHGRRGTGPASRQRERERRQAPASNQRSERVRRRR